MNKLVVKLKQHTPIIHFQHEQKGATLRASELKPKLDKFIIKHAFDEDFEEYKEFLIGWNEKKSRRDYADKKPLDYKIKIQSNYVFRGSPEEPNKQLYFGNMGTGENKYSIFEPNDNTVIIEFFSFNEKLIGIIKENISFFFAINNFGTRQNKGFGSFYIDPDDENYRNFMEVLKSTSELFLFIECDTNKDYNKQFDDISVIYNLMKSGINNPDHPMINLVINGETQYKNGRPKKTPDYHIKGENAFYYRSFLFQYFHDLGVGNEKHFIKENFFNAEVRILDDGLPKNYLRAMLGICDGIKFRDDLRNEKISYKSTVDRFKSPLTFKIVDNYIIIIPEVIPEKMKNLNFIFSLSHIDQNHISTPKKFDLKDFLKKYAEYFNNLDTSCLSGKRGKLVDMVKSAKLNRISIYEGANNA